MEALISLLVFCQALGALGGALAVVWGELAYVRAMRDGKIDSAERTHLRIIAHGLRFGMMLLLLSSLGLIIIAYWLRTTPQPALSASYWMLIVLAYLTLGLFPPISFGAAVAFFVVATAIFYAVLQSGRFLALRKK